MLLRAWTNNSGVAIRAPVARTTERVVAASVFPLPKNLVSVLNVVEKRDCSDKRYETGWSGKEWCRLLRIAIAKRRKPQHVREVQVVLQFGRLDSFDSTFFKAVGIAIIQTSGIPDKYEANRSTSAGCQ